ncbi:MAG: response regulator [Leptospira sp.]|nr:response regulator [Leptospira sp.]
MSQWRILIVEDEQIVARDLQLRLKRMEYDVPSIASSGDEAMVLVASDHPNLVLTDINLGTKPDGIELAGRIRSEYDLPVIYITAFTDNDTLKRAQLTEPYGYVVKPFHDRELQIAIEIGIYKHRMERDLRENRSWLAAILQSIGDAVIATDDSDRVVFLNPAAEILTGWTEKDARGINLSLIFNVSMRKNFFSPWIQFSDREYPQTDYFNETILITKKGKERAIHSTVSELKNEKGNRMGEVVIFRESAPRESLFLPALR